MSKNKSLKAILVRTMVMDGSLGGDSDSDRWASAPLVMHDAVSLIGQMCIGRQLDIESASELDQKSKDNGNFVGGQRCMKRSPYDFMAGHHHAIQASRRRKPAVITGGDRRKYCGSNKMTTL